jgi:hypothetical protein
MQELFMKPARVSGYATRDCFMNKLLDGNFMESLQDSGGLVCHSDGEGRGVV